MLKNSDLKIISNGFRHTYFMKNAENGHFKR
jgi:hypothetical protein